MPLKAGKKTKKAVVRKLPLNKTSKSPKSKAVVAKKGVKEQDGSHRVIGAETVSPPPKRPIGRPRIHPLPDPNAPKKRMGRPPKHTRSEFTAQQRAASDRIHREGSNSIRDIYTELGRSKLKFDPSSSIDWKRRLACKDNLQLFCSTYLAPVFYLGWSNDQKRCLLKAQTVIQRGGMFSLAMPRGGGKTAICRAAILWGTAYGYRHFPYFIGASLPKAEQTLDFVKTYWSNSPLLLEDFPEIAYPIFRLEGRNHMARGQLFRGEATYVDWGADRIQYPCLLLHKDLADPYLQNDPESLLYLPDKDAYLSTAAGTIIATAGITGAIRGDAEVHPLLLTQPRPDLVLLDDIQKDEGADSPSVCDKIMGLVDGAIQGLAGPGKTIAALMPCTVIREDDVSDTYLNITKKPEWQGERCRLVETWPDGITDTTISLETEAGKHWNRYSDLRQQSFRLHKDIRLAKEYYIVHRAEMDEGFVCSWPERYDPVNEVSPQQHAMNLRLTNPVTFPAEFQNIGRRNLAEGMLLVNAAQVAEKTIKVERFHVPVDTYKLTAFIDIQNEVLFMSVLASSPDFTSVVPFYGTYPEVSNVVFSKYQTDGWGLLTKEFFKSYPEHRDMAWKTEGGKVRAPLEAKIYHALACAVNYLKALSFVKDDGHGTPIKLDKIGIDTSWGQVNDVVKRFCRECGHPEVVPYHGQGITPGNKQIEEFTRVKGWLFEDQVNPQVKEVKWVYRPDEAGQYRLMVDVNRMKDFLMARLASPPGTPGCLSLYDAPPNVHELFASHLCDSEYPEPTSARGITKNMWKLRENRPDNDWLDCLVGCLALASMCGCYLRTDHSKLLGPSATVERKLSRLWDNKHKESAARTAAVKTPA